MPTPASATFAAAPVIGGGEYHAPPFDVPVGFAGGSGLEGDVGHGVSRAGTEGAATKKEKGPWLGKPRAQERLSR